MRVPRTHNNNSSSDFSCALYFFSNFLVVTVSRSELQQRVIHLLTNVSKCTTVLYVPYLYLVHACVYAVLHTGRAWLRLHVLS